MQALEGKVALVAGGTRGAGRGISVELGAAGATVYVTGRSTKGRPSEYNRPETIEETAALVALAGGEGVFVRVDHLVPSEVAALVARIRKERGRLDILVNDVWGGENLFEWDKPVWEHNLENGLRLLRLAIDTHLITAHHALPLMIEKPGGLLVEVTDGTAEYNADHYRLSPFYDLAKVAATRMPGAREGPREARRDRRLDHAGLDALGDARPLQRVRRDLARRAENLAAFRDLGIAALRRPRHRRARHRPGARALERRIAVERRPRAGLRIYGRGRLTPGLLAVYRGGAGSGEGGRRDGVSMTAGRVEGGVLHDCHASRSKHDAQYRGRQRPRAIARYCRRRDRDRRVERYRRRGESRFGVLRGPLPAGLRAAARRARPAHHSRAAG